MAQASGEVTYAKLRSGAWGLRTAEELTPGETVTVTKKGGEQKTETVGPLEATFESGVRLYTIANPVRSDAASQPIPPSEDDDVPF